MEENIQIEVDDDLLFKLRTYLNYELSTSVLLILSFFFSILLFLIVFAALVFTPFMIYVLYKNEKYGWITAFGIFMVIPVIIILIIDVQSFYKISFLLTGLAVFYFYCFTLRFSVNDWCENINWKMVRKEQERNKFQNDLYP